MPRERIVVALWVLLFTFGTAALIGGLSGVLFAFVGDVDSFVVALIGVLWAVVPMAMGALATRLAALGKLPGTRRPA